jgi:hypothetical protein
LVTGRAQRLVEIHQRHIRFTTARRGKQPD